MNPSYFYEHHESPVTTYTIFSQNNKSSLLAHHLKMTEASGSLRNGHHKDPLKHIKIILRRFQIAWLTIKCTWDCFWIRWSVIRQSLRLSSTSTSVEFSISFSVMSMLASSFLSYNNDQLGNVSNIFEDYYLVLKVQKFSAKRMKSHKDLYSEVRAITHNENVLQLNKAQAALNKVLIELNNCNVKLNSPM